MLYQGHFVYFDKGFEKHWHILWTFGSKDWHEFFFSTTSVAWYVQGSTRQNLRAPTWILSTCTTMLHSNLWELRFSTIAFSKMYAQNDSFSSLKRLGCTKIMKTYFCKLVCMFQKAALFIDLHFKGRRPFFFQPKVSLK